MSYFVGVDWASVEHVVCVITDRAQIVWRGTVPHTAAGLAELCARLTRLAPPATLPVAVERPSGLLIDMLVDAGFAVVPIHPNILKASRPRYTAAQGKSDAGDAFILADLLRTDGHRFRPLQPLSDDTRALRALVRARDDVVAHRVALANQLRALLESFWPGAAQIFADVDSPIALAFLHRYPTPHSAERVGEKRLAAFLAHHHYCGRRSPAELLARLHQAPATTGGEAVSDAKGELVRMLVAILAPLVRQLQHLTSAIEHAMPVHADGPMLMSFPRTGRINAAQLLAELGDDRLRFASPEHLAAEAGVAPVTHSSGKHRGVTFRWACNKRLRRAVTAFADNSRHASRWAAHVYEQARVRGCDHPHAIRILGRAWVRVLWRCWQNRTLYNPIRHGAAQSLLCTVAEIAGATGG
jgi:transposase